MLIDTHAHLYLDRFDADRDAILERARQAGVGAVLMPAIDVASIHRALDLCDRYAGLRVMAALHPSETKDATDADFEAVQAFCADDRVIAVGESGLDYYWDRSFDAAQHRFLRRHVQLAIDTDLPLILHSRDKKGREEVFEDLVRLIEDERSKHPEGERLRGIFHCFGGPAWLAERAADLGFMLGLGGTLTFKNGGVDALVQDVPMEQIVLETDAPFLAPAPHRGTRNEPAHVRLVAEKLAEVKDLPIEEVERITTANACRLFRLDPADLAL